MCAVFGFLDYGKKIPHRLLTRIFREMSIAAESRGADATGMSYVKNGKIVTFKKAKPAHRMKLYFPQGTTAVMGHTRFTTQGSEKYNYNNHPFEGKTDEHCFSLAHNGVLYNDQKLRNDLQLPMTPIETDSYIAVQILERLNTVDQESLRYLAETVRGSYVFSILRDDNTLFLIKGYNPVTVLHISERGLFLYASTLEILTTALCSVKLFSASKELVIETGDILSIDVNGNVLQSRFHDWNDFYSFNNYRICLEDYPVISGITDEEINMLCTCYRIREEDVRCLLDYGYSLDEIEEMLEEHYFGMVLEEAKQ